MTRTRFAPSPTGRMHVGNLRTALYAYLIAKHEKGEFILRIEDTDQNRYVEGAVDIIYRTLDRAGIKHDEGPDNEKECGPYVQSERCKQGIYMEYAQKLINKGEAYYCFCDKCRLDTLHKEVSGKVISVYDKHCLTLTPEEIEDNLKSGKPFVIRQNNPTEGTTTFSDVIYGDITVNNEELDDMILIKSDGYPTYNFANVVDDHLMGITHIVRGNEYLSSSPKYNRLYEAFGWDVPIYVHCPLITDHNHQKLSKRSGHSSFEDLLEQGFLPEAIVNYVSLLGWSPEDNEEIMSMDELIEKFDYMRIGKAPAVFDINKLRWMNGEYIKKMDFKDFCVLAKPYIVAAVGEKFDCTLIAKMVQTRIETFNDIEDHISFFEKMGTYDIGLYDNKKSKCNLEIANKVLLDTLEIINFCDKFDNDTLYEVLCEYAKDSGLKIGTVMWAIRIAISGKMNTPAGATGIMEVLGKTKTVERIKAALGRF